MVGTGREAGSAAQGLTPNRSGRRRCTARSMARGLRCRRRTTRRRGCGEDEGCDQHQGSGSCRALPTLGRIHLHPSRCFIAPHDLLRTTGRGHAEASRDRSACAGKTCTKLIASSLLTGPEDGPPSVNPRALTSQKAHMGSEHDRCPGSLRVRGQARSHDSWPERRIRSAWPPAARSTHQSAWPYGDPPPQGAARLGTNDVVLRDRPARRRCGPHSAR